MQLFAEQMNDVSSYTKKNSHVEGWGGLSKKSNVKMSKECPKLAVMHNTLIVKKSNCWTMDETQNFNC